MAAVVFDILPLLLDVIRAGYKYVDSVRHLQKEVKAVTGEVEHVRGLVQVMITSLHLEPSPSIRLPPTRFTNDYERHSEEVKRLFHVEISACMDTLKELLDILGKIIPKDGFSAEPQKHLKYPLTKSKIEEFLLKIANHIKQFEFLFSFYQAYVVS